MNNERTHNRTSLTSNMIATAILIAISTARAAEATNLPVEGRSIQAVSATDVSGSSPWARSQCNSASTKPGYQNTWSLAEPFMAEPMVAVDPKNPRNRIIAWQDRLRGTLDTAFTKDGGKTWRLSPPKGFDNCTGNLRRPWQGTADVWLSFGPTGRAYLSGLPFANFSPVPTGNYIELTRVAISLSGGSKWSWPVTVPNALRADDKDSVLSDSRRPELVYTASRNIGFGMPIGRRGDGELLFGRSTDGGRSFTSQIVDRTGNAKQSFGNPLLAEFPDGTLLYTYQIGLGGPTVARRSTDGGRTWSNRISVAEPPAPANVKACGSVVELRGDSGQIAEFGRQHVLLAYVRQSTSGVYELVLARSENQGRSWRQSLVLNSRLPIGLPSVAADRHGTIAVVYDQIDPSRIECGANPPNPIIPARTVVTISRKGGHSWQSVTIGARWWNFSAGGVDSFFGGYWVGDYQGIAPTPDGFMTATPQGPSLLGRGPKGGISGDMSIVAGEIELRSLR